MINQKKIVVFTQRVEIIESYNERRDCADQRIADFLNACGYLPIPLPNDYTQVDAYIHAVKPVGIVLTGGNSMVKYGGTAPERDEMDFVLLEIAKKDKIPVYGFCRGMQSILDYFGNPLEQVSGHVAVNHAVHGTIEEFVNSYHNQACVKLREGSGLKVLAQSDDGVIESVTHNEYPMLGTMWHPERVHPYREADVERVRNLFG